MKHFLLICCLLTAGLLNGQSAIKDSLGALYPFLDLGQNHLFFPGDTLPWKKLFRQMNRLRQGEARQFQVMHLGGSHVQGGSLSRQIRHRIAALIADSTGGQPGFFFPYTLANTNCPQEIRIVADHEWQGARSAKRDQPGPFGLAGLNARTPQLFETVDVSYQDAHQPLSRFHTVRIFGQSLHQQMVLEPISPDCPATVMMDSIHHFQEWCYDQDQDRMSFRIMPVGISAPDTFILQGIQYITDHPGLVFHQVGANGASLLTTLRCEGFGDQLFQVTSDLVIFGIGVNDAHMPTQEFKADRFMTRYDSLMTLFRKANPQVLFLFLTNNDTYYKRRPNKNGPEVREAMLLLARKWDAAVWDQFTVMGGLGSVQKWTRARLAKKDRLHFTREGYTLAADLFGDALEEAFYRFNPSTQIHCP
ncbi:MAG: hypothetical protein K9I85_09280 [Saprospiraceae bacterium]|nr:hypothetical protein [Saprospiraceae bacterium]